MKMHGIQVLIVLIFLACLSGVEGQYGALTSGYQIGGETLGVAPDMATQYTQYYQMLSGPAPSNHISAPQQIDITGTAPLMVFFSNQQQPVNYAQYAASPSYTGSSSLWVQGSTSWTQYAVVPQGAIVNLLAVTPTADSGYLYFTDSDGQTYTYNDFFYPYSRLTFYADIPGRHVFYFVVNGMVSNQVIIDVTGTYTPPSNYLPPAHNPGYFSGNYPDYLGANYLGGNYETGGYITNVETGDHHKTNETGDHGTGPKGANVTEQTGANLTGPMGPTGSPGLIGAGGTGGMGGAGGAGGADAIGNITEQTGANLTGPMGPTGSPGLIGAGGIGGAGEMGGTSGIGGVGGKGAIGFMGAQGATGTT